MVFIRRRLVFEMCSFIFRERFGVLFDFWLFVVWFFLRYVVERVRVREVEVGCIF